MGEDAKTVWMKKKPVVDEQTEQEKQQKKEEYIQSFVDSVQRFVDQTPPEMKLELFKPLDECPKCGENIFDVEFIDEYYNPGRVMTVSAWMAVPVSNKLTELFPQLKINVSDHDYSYSNYACITVSLKGSNYQVLKTTCKVCGYSFNRKPKDAK